MEWRVRDFKGIVTCELDLAPGTTTILTGANSSGKTSLLQSLLLLRQSGHARDGIVLNGPLVRLGKATDLVRDGASQSTAKFTITDNGSTFDFEIKSSATTANDAAEKNDADPLNSEMHLTDLRIHSGGKRVGLHFSEDHSSRSDVQTIVEQQVGLPSLSVLHLKADGVRLQKNKFARVYAVFHGLRCVKIVKFYPKATLRNLYTKQLRQFIGLYKDLAGSDRIAHDDAIEFHPIQYVVRTLFHDLSNYLHELSPAQRRRADRISRHSRSSGYRGTREEHLVSGLLSLTEDQIEELIAKAVEERCEVPMVTMDISQWLFPSRYTNYLYEDNVGTLETRLLETCQEVLNEIEAYVECWQDLSRRINYLGPLRDEPRVVWNQWNSETPGLPVGSRGELTANYYAKNRDREIEYASPPDRGSSRRRRQTLTTAVEQWLDYLGIGSSLQATSHGKIGVGLEVAWEGKRRDLTSLGVGVSQAVPIVIAGLAASADSIFIVEQPELHLHPDVQARLADFFIYSRPNVNFIIETHSEALITRVRRRIAEGDLEPARVHLTFVEPWMTDRGKRSVAASGATSRKIEFTSMGDLSEWPAGFIGTSLEDTNAIMRATVKRLSSKEIDIDA